MRPARPLGPRRARAAGRLLWAVALLGCSGTIAEAPVVSNGPAGPDGPASAKGGRGATNGPNSGSGAPNTDPGDWIGDGDDGDPSGMEMACTPDALTATTRLPRLTHAQYDNTVSSLLYLDVHPAAAFLADPTFAGFDNSAEGLSVADRLGRDYRRAAEELAAQAVGDAEAYRKLVTCNPAASGCAREFITAFLRRAYRRPATSAEIDRYAALHQMAPALSDGGDAFVAGVQLVIEAALQSPSFLYRTELSSEVGSEGFIDLTDHEIAARLSYALWNTMPDDTLAERADAGQLHTPEQVAEQAQRMLEDARAQATVADFHRQWLDLAAYEDLLRDPEQFPLFSPDLADAMKAETQEFVRHVTFDLEEGLHTLLTAPFTFVNRDTAPLYGVRGSFGAGMTKVDLDPAQRSGLLTQLGFLASHAFFGISSPIHRGVFVHRKILCSALPDPPGNANLVLPPIEGAIKTTRQQVDVHTSPDACKSCHHTMINPAGYAFENFDAVGQWRTTDHGEPVDAAAELTIDGEPVMYDGAIEFTRAVAESQSARACYATNWLRYLYARTETGADRCTIASVARAMSDSTYSTKDMLADLTRTRAFLQRAPEESP